MRRIDFVHQQGADGGINNRTAVPSPPRPTGERPFSDGHASCILKAYREAKNHPDDSWLKTYWPRIKKGVEYLIARDAATSNGEPDGTLSDDQWNTYDNAIHGVNTFIGSYYLAALRAGEEMAKRMGDTASAQRWHVIFEKGQENLVKLCWNGEYFYQNLPDYDKRAGEYGPGCLSDQLIGQWWAHQLGLGYILPKDHVRAALRSILKYNWLTDHTDWRHNWRKFAGGTDKGLLICTWPKGGRPAETIPYVDEVWTGIEYQVAAHMIYEGMVDEGLTIVKGVRERYDGVPRVPIPRSPWNEIECGGHYARAMSSWSLLLALSGFEYDGPNGSIRFTPRTTPANFKCFFSAAEGWGSLRQTRRGEEQKIEMKVEAGRVSLRELHLSMNGNQAPKRLRVQVNGKAVRCTLTTAGDRVRVLLDDRLSVATGQTLTVITD
jgi:non-lysosomal glucosylceramidase